MNKWILQLSRNCKLYSSWTSNLKVSMQDRHDIASSEFRYILGKLQYYIHLTRQKFPQTWTSVVTISSGNPHRSIHSVSVQPRMCKTISFSCLKLPCLDDRQRARSKLDENFITISNEIRRKVYVLKQRKDNCFF